MEKATTLGRNRTGVDMSPLDFKELLEGTENTVPSSPGDESQIAAVRSEYAAEAETIGSIPVPGTLKGLAKSTLKKLSGNKPEIFIDKLGERLAFERTGTRLYDALITKCQVLTNSATVSLDLLRQFRDEEAQHFRLVAAALEHMGADPTSQTPAADVSGVASSGILQVLSDPRTTLDQCLQAVLIAELADHAGWTLLIQLAGEMGLDDLVQQFTNALVEERVHLDQINQWHQEVVLSLAEGKTSAKSIKFKKKGPARQRAS